MELVNYGVNVVIAQHSLMLFMYIYMKLRLYDSEVRTAISTSSN